MLLELNLLSKRLTNIVLVTFVFLFQTNDHSHHVSYMRSYLLFPAIGRGGHVGEGVDGAGQDDSVQRGYCVSPARKRFLLHVESQARSKQEEERKIINQLQEEWAKKVAEDKEA